MKEFTVYLDDELLEWLKTEASLTGLKQAEIVRAGLRAIREGKLDAGYKAAKPRGKAERLKQAKSYAKDLIEGKTPATMYPGRRWQRCPYLFKSAHGKYHCFETKEVYPKCFHGCKAYYPRKKPS